MAIEVENRIDTKADKTLLEMKDCKKTFPGVVALDGVHLSVGEGDCLALVGENGAGKSTLCKCITGEYVVDGGELSINGKPVDLSSYGISDSQDSGIAIVHQEFQLMDEMTGLENIFVGHYENSGLFIDWKDLEHRAREILDFMHVDVDLNVPVKHLRTAEKQIIQLAKAIRQNARLIILDELTAVLQEKEIENIFRILNILLKRGIGIIYVSHRLEEIFTICNKYTVLCDGKYIGSGYVKDVSKDKLVEMIIGRELSNMYPEFNQEVGEEMVRLKNYTAADGAFKNIDLTVHAGEVVGIAGLVGAGKTELVNAMFGNYKNVSGEMYLRGELKHFRNPEQAIKNGLGLVPDERKQLGLNMIYDIRNNTTMPSWKKFIKGLFSDHAEEKRQAKEFNDMLKLKYQSVDQLVMNLSGGNQQKVVIAKWLLADCDVFLFDEPTRGIDVGAKFEIYKLIQNLTREGKAVIIVSPELDELIGLSNRIYIMYEGEVKDEVFGDRMKQEEIISSLLGVDVDE